MTKEKRRIKIADIIFTIIALAILIKLYGVYKSYYYNGFVKAVYKSGITEFTRDKKVTYSDYNYSYKIYSKDFNDAIFYKSIEVKPNTPYKLSCMVKTENVIPQNNSNNAGVQISTADTMEETNPIIGTNDWQKLEFIFDSKNRSNIEVGFRLGGDIDYAKGTVWFTDFKLEEGVKDNSTKWNVACFIFKNIDVKLDNKEIKLNVSPEDISNVKMNMARFKNSIQTLSNKKMTATYKIYEIDEPIKSISYSEEFGYYVDPLDVKDIIKEYLDKDEYDYIFTVIRLGDTSENIEIPVNDWIGLRRNGFVWNRIFKYKTTK